MTTPRPAALALAALLAAPAAAPAQIGDLFSRGVDAVQRQANRRVSTSVDVTDVDLATLRSQLTRLGVTIPVDADGKVTASLSVSVIPTEPRASLRLDGSLSSPRLSLAPAGGAGGDAAGRPVILTKVAAEVAAADGVLTLSELAFTLPRGADAGRVTGAATLPYAEPGDASAKLTAKSLPLDLIWDRFAPDAVRGGTADLKLDLAAPSDRLTDPAAWTGTSALRIDGFTAGDREIRQVAADLALGGGVAKLTSLTATVAGQPVGGAASVAVAAPHRFAAALTSRGFDLAGLDTLLPGGTPRPDASGTLDLRVDAKGTLVPPAATARGTLRGEDLTLNELAVRSVAADFGAILTPGSEGAKLTDLRLVTDRGTLTGTATASAADGTWKVSGDLTDASAAGIIELVPECKRPPAWLLGRTGTLAASGTANGALGPFALTAARGTLRGENLEGLLLPIPEATAEVSADAARARFTNVVLRSLGGTVTGTVAVDFTADDLATTGTFDAAALDLAALPPGLLPAAFAATGTGAGRGRFDFRFPIVEPAPAPDADGFVPFDPCLPRRGFRVESAAGDAELTDPAITLPTGGTAAFAAASGAVEIRDDVVTVRDLAVRDAGSAGTLAGGGTVGLNAPNPVRARVRWDGWPADSLAAAAFPDWAAANPRPADEGDGTVSGTAAADGTLAPFDLSTADGLVRARDARLPRPGGGVLAVPAADAEFALTPDRLRVTELDVTAGGGTLTGSADLGLTGDRAFTADLAADAFPLATVGDLLGDPAGFAGAVDLKLDARGTLDPATATGSLTASGTDLRVAGVPVGTFEAAAEADGQSVVVRRLAATVGGASVGGAARVRLAGDRPFAAAVNLTGVNPGRLAADLAGLLPPDAADALAQIRGTLAAAVTAEGALDTGRARVTAAVTAPRLAVAVPPVRDEPGLEPGALELENAAVDLVLTRAPDGEVDLKVERLTGGLAGGSVRATATVPLLPPERSPTDAPAAAGGAGDGGEADVIAEDVDLSALLDAAFPAGLSAGGPAPITGRATLAAAAAWPAGVPSFETVSANARLTSDALTVARDPAGGGRGVAGTTAKAVTVDARLAGGAARLEAEADALGGSLAATVGLTRRRAGPDGRVRTGPAGRPARTAGDPAAFETWPVRAAGTAKLTNANLTELERLAGAVGDVRLARLADRAGIRGELDADVAFDSHPVAAVSRTGRRSGEAPPRVSGRVRVAWLRAGELSLTESAEATFRVRDGGDWRVGPLTGRYGGGTFTAEAFGLPAGVAGFAPGAARVRLTLRDASAAAAAAPIPWLRDNVTGRLSLSAEGVLGPTWRLSGRGALRGGTFLDFFKIDRWQLPATLTYDPTTGAGEVRLTEAAAGLAGGTATGTAKISFGRGRGVGVDVGVDLGGPDAGRLLNGAGGAAASGRVNGSLVLQGRRVTGLNDLTGSARLTLAGGQPRGLPIVDRVVPFLGGGAAAGGGGQRGALDATLRAGVARVQRFTLSSSGVRVFGEGTVTAATGRLDLDVVADTGRRDAAEAVLLRLAEEAAGPTPVGLALRASRLLRDRVVYLKVTGTAERPVVRIQADRQLREEAARFLLGELLVPAGGAGAAGAAAAGAGG